MLCVTMDKDKIRSVLEQVLKWLKILVAVLMFLLGLVNEGARFSDPNSELNKDLNDADSISNSIFGFILAAFTGWPCLFAAGAEASRLFVNGF